LASVGVMDMDEALGSATLEIRDSLRVRRMGDVKIA
jgi:hypothetical protein